MPKNTSSSKVRGHNPALQYSAAHTNIILHEKLTFWTSSVPMFPMFVTVTSFTSWIIQSIISPVFIIQLYKVTQQCNNQLYWQIKIHSFHIPDGRTTANIQRKRNPYCARILINTMHEFSCLSFFDNIQWYKNYSFLFLCKSTPNFQSSV